MYNLYHVTKVLLCVTFLYFTIYFSTYLKIKFGLHQVVEIYNTK